MMYPDSSNIAYKILSPLFPMVLLQLTFLSVLELVLVMCCMNVYELIRQQIRIFLGEPVLLHYVPVYERDCPVFSLTLDYEFDVLQNFNTILPAVKNSEMK